MSPEYRDSLQGGYWNVRKLAEESLCLRLLEYFYWRFLIRSDWLPVNGINKHLQFLSSGVGVGVGVGRGDPLFIKYSQYAPSFPKSFI